MATAPVTTQPTVSAAVSHAASTGAALGAVGEIQSFHDGYEEDDGDDGVHTSGRVVLGTW